MMALDEYKETAERHSFLETQRKDLIESIENTMETIKEIDRISRTKFDEAFARINENFGQVFTRLFRAARPSCASPMQKIRPRADSKLSPHPRAKSCKTSCCSPAEKKPSPRWRCWSESSSSSPAPSAFSTKSTPRSTKPT